MTEPTADDIVEGMTQCKRCGTRVEQDEHGLPVSHDGVDRFCTNPSKRTQRSGKFQKGGRPPSGKPRTASRSIVFELSDLKQIDRADKILTRQLGEDKTNRSRVLRYAWGWITNTLSGTERRVFGAVLRELKR